MYVDLGQGGFIFPSANCNLPQIQNSVSENAIQYSLQIIFLRIACDCYRIT